MTKNIDADVRQFKLANGEEILCEVVQWSEHMEEIEILTRKAMRLIMQENGDGFKYYAVRPWMVYQESDEDLIILNSNHVVGIAFPTRTLLLQYYEAVADMNEMHNVRETEYEEEHRVTASKKGDKIDDYLSRMDSGSNVIDMFSDKKLH